MPARHAHRFLLHRTCIRIDVDRGHGSATSCTSAGRSLRTTACNRRHPIGLVVSIDRSRTMRSTCFAAMSRVICVNSKTERASLARRVTSGAPSTRSGSPNSFRARFYRIFHAKPMPTLAEMFAGSARMAYAFAYSSRSLARSMSSSTASTSSELPAIDCSTIPPTAPPLAATRYANHVERHPRACALHACFRH